MDITQALGGSKALREIVGTDVVDAIKLISELGDKWQDIVAKAKALYRPIADARNAVEVFDAVRAGLKTAEVAAVFKAAGEQELLKRLIALADKVDSKLPEELRTLLKPLGDFDEAATDHDKVFPGWSTGKDDGCIRWKADGNILSKAPAPGNGDAAEFRLGGKVGIECEAGSLWFYANDQVPSKGLVRLGLAGGLTGSVAGKTPFGQFGIDAAANCQAHVFWRCQDLKQSYLSALGGVLKAQVDIFSLDKVWEAAHPAVPGAADKPEFVGAILAIDGHANVDVDLGLARDFGAQGVFTAQAKLTVKVDLKRKAAYELSVLKTATGLRLVLSHGVNDARQWGIGAGIEIDPAPLTRRIADMIGEATDYWDKALKEITPFLSPGTWVRDKLATELVSVLDTVTHGVPDDIADALRHDLRLALGYDDTASGLAKLLTDKLADAIGSVENAVTSEVRTVTDKALAALKAQLPALLSAEFTEPLTTEVDRLVKALKDGFDAEVKKLADSDIAAEVDKALARLGKPVANAVSAANARADSIRNAVADADKRIHDLAKAAKEAAIGKISARLDFETSRVEGESYEFAGEITRVNDDTRLLYQSILTGQLQAVSRLFAPGASMPIGLIPVKERCSVRRFSQVSDNLGYEVVLFGLTLSGQAYTMGEADVVMALNGDVEVKSQAIARRTNKAWEEGRTTRFIQGYSMALRSLDKGRQQELRQGMRLDLTTERTDTNLTTGELKQYLAVMVRVGLVGDDRVKALDAYVGSKAPSRAQPKLSGTLNVALTFNEREIGNLVSRGKAIAAGIALADREKAEREVYDFALRNMLSSGEWKQDDFIQWVETYFDPRVDLKGTLEEQRDAACRRLFDYRRKDPVERRTGRDPLDAHFGPGRYKWQALGDFEKLLTGLAEIWDAEPRGLGDTDRTKWDAQTYRLKEAEVAGYAQKWLGTNFQGLGFGKDVDQCTVALMRTLAGLATTSQGTFDSMVRISLAVPGETRAF